MGRADDLGLAVDRNEVPVHHRELGDRADDRIADDVGERDLPAAVALQEVVDHDPVVGQQLRRNRAHRRGGRNVERGCHVLDHCGGHAAQRGDGVRLFLDRPLAVRLRAARQIVGRRGRRRPADGALGCRGRRPGRGGRRGRCDRCRLRRCCRGGCARLRSVRRPPVPAHWAPHSGGRPGSVAGAAAVPAGGLAFPRGWPPPMSCRWLSRRCPLLRRRCQGFGSCRPRRWPNRPRSRSSHHRGRSSQRDRWCRRRTRRNSRARWCQRCSDLGGTAGTSPRRTNHLARIPGPWLTTLSAPPCCAVDVTQC